MSTSLNFKLLTYALAGPVSGGGGGAGRFAAWSKYQKPAKPASNTMPITMAAGGITTGCLAGIAVLFATNGHLSDLQCRGRHRPPKIQVRADRFQPHQHILQIPGDRDFRNRERQLAVANPH